MVVARYCDWGAMSQSSHNDPQASPAKPHHHLSTTGCIESQARLRLFQLWVTIALGTLLAPNMSLRYTTYQSKPWVPSYTAPED